MDEVNKADKKAIQEAAALEASAPKMFRDQKLKAYLEAGQKYLAGGNKRKAAECCQ